jgi:sec-independent protein translocase protein TatA
MGYDGRMMMTETVFAPPLAWTLQWPELVIILFIALLIFGKRLPDVARSLGRGINQFKNGLREVGDEADPMSGDDDPPRNGPEVKPLPPPQEPVARVSAEQKQAEAQQRQADAAEA